MSCADEYPPERVAQITHQGDGAMRHSGSSPLIGGAGYPTSSAEPSGRIDRRPERRLLGVEPGPQQLRRRRRAAVDGRQQGLPPGHGRRVELDRREVARPPTRCARGHRGQHQHQPRIDLARAQRRRPPPGSAAAPGCRPARCRAGSGGRPPRPPRPRRRRCGRSPPAPRRCRARRRPPRTAPGQPTGSGPDRRVGRPVGDQPQLAGHRRIVRDRAAGPPGSRRPAARPGPARRPGPRCRAPAGWSAR